jgi:hypothetical protein
LQEVAVLVVAGALVFPAPLASGFPAEWLLFSGTRFGCYQNHPMKIIALRDRHPARHLAGTTLLDVLFAILGTVFLFVTVYLGFTQGFAVIQLARENLRATQILQERMETVWLYNWDQLNTAGFIPTNFQAPFYPVGAQNGQGLTYNGTVSVEPSGLTESYAADLRRVTVQVSWVSGEALRQRTMTTLVSRYGMHNYIYYNN